jgi:hypothetical protein
VELHNVEQVEERIRAVPSSRPVSVLWTSVDNRNEKNCRYSFEPGVLGVQVQGILLKVILDILVIVLFVYGLFDL